MILACRQGFVDAHLHLMMGAQTLETLDLNSVRSQEEMATMLASAAGVPLSPPYNASMSERLVKYSNEQASMSTVT